ncbi:MAG: hypothetical protein GSR87_00505 [Desulfurococcales archaeon]|nr:hypothetical protein [Desulfurococcales archaeon]
MNQDKKTIALILTLGILIGILAGYNIGYNQGRNTGRQEALNTINTVENKYKLLLLLEKLNQIQELETTAIKEALQLNTNSTLPVQTSNKTIQISREAVNIAKTIRCNQQTSKLLENLTTNLADLTQKPPTS